MRQELKKGANVWCAPRSSVLSYSVYLVHFPAMVFIAAFMKDFLDIGYERPRTPATIIYALVLLVILYVYAWLFAALTEVHTNPVRSRLSLAISNLPYRVHFLDRSQLAK